jgi:hypothetical protein
MDAPPVRDHLLRVIRPGGSAHFTRFARCERWVTVVVWGWPNQRSPEAKEGRMPLSEKRPLTSAAMVGDAERSAAADRSESAASDANRIEALTKLKALYDSGVLTEEQYDSERARLIEGV